jgi:hypothetical protein
MVNDVSQVLGQKRAHHHDGGVNVVFPKGDAFKDGCHSESINPQGLQGLSHRNRSVAICVRFDNGQDFRGRSNPLTDLMEITG